MSRELRDRNPLGIHHYPAQTDLEQDGVIVWEYIFYERIGIWVLHIGSKLSLQNFSHLFKLHRVLEFLCTVIWKRTAMGAALCLIRCIVGNEYQGDG